MYKQIWNDNVRRLLAENNLSLSEAARLIGTSKQYLSSILAESEPQSTKEHIMHRLCLLLHTNPARLYAMQGTESVTQVESQAIVHAEQAESAADLAILAERHFLAKDYVGCHEVVGKLLNEYAFELSPAATAQALLLAGKCCCLQGHASEARKFLREALVLFQKRLTAQPDKYLPLCMDTYRYLGLAEYSDGDYQQAIKAYLRIFTLAKRYPEFSTELIGKVDNAGTGLLRAASKLGKLSSIRAVVEDIEIMAGQLELGRLSCRARLEDKFCSYLVNAVDPTPELGGCHTFATDPFAALQYGLLLWGTGRTFELTQFANRMTQEAEAELAFVGAWLKDLLSLSGHADPLQNLAHLESLLDPQWPNLYKALLMALKAAWLKSTGHEVQSFYLWQDALFVLKSNRETPYYLYCLKWFILSCDSMLTDADREVFQSALDRAIVSFTQ